MDLWATGIPWEAVASAIDNETFAYKPGSAAEKQFESQTGHPWTNLDEPSTFVVLCPACTKRNTVEWTTCSSAKHWSRKHRGNGGEGFADTEFYKMCRCCSTVIDHDILRCGKFVADVERLMQSDVPMPGTFLSLDGKLQL